MIVGDPVAVFIVADDVNGEPVELYWPEVVIEEIEVEGWWATDVITFTLRPVSEGLLTPIPYAPKHRKPKHLKET